MIVVDTSIWIDANRRPGGADAATLKGLLDADEVALALPVRIELLAGSARQSRAAFRRALSALPLIFPTESTWQQIERWVPTAADAGYRFSVPDLLVAALADELGALVWSLDADFQHMEELGMVKRY